MENIQEKSVLTLRIGSSFLNPLILSQHILDLDASSHFSMLLIITDLYLSVFDIYIYMHTSLCFPSLQCYVSLFMFYCIFIRSDFISILGFLFYWSLCTGSLSGIQILGGSMECSDTDCLQCNYFWVFHIFRCLWVSSFLHILMVFVFSVQQQLQIQLYVLMPIFTSKKVNNPWCIWKIKCQ